MAKRGKAFRMWKSHTKYVSRINKNIYYWNIKDDNAPRGYRDAKNWKELDSDPSSKVKQYKKTATKWTYKCDQYDAHKKVKTLRKESKDLTNNTLKELDHDTLQ